MRELSPSLKGSEVKSDFNEFIYSFTYVLVSRPPSHKHYVH